jgi:acetylornithine deacetylase/succinyl-diaminopimelate desuccinylase-like protein
MLPAPFLCLSCAILIPSIILLADPSAAVFAQTITALAAAPAPCRTPSPPLHCLLLRSLLLLQKLRDECLRGAKFLARLLEGLGAEVKMSQCVEGKNPVVLGRLGNNPAHPTVVFYGHYDVQPAEEPDWRTAPWTLCAVDGYLCGRGTSDNKGPILAFVYAIKVGGEPWGVCAG